ncbi:MAG: SIS domain-containing protein, partial [Synergistaceae bacterium]|jgi:fructoselysine-6-P-deglycase FrlB-like protein|nr:SIS domain-containing protein [Synergistaceae bacterium]
MSLLYEEIMNQPEALRKTFDYMKSLTPELKSSCDISAGSKVIFLGCGSSYCLAQSGSLAAQSAAGCNSLAVAGGDLLLNLDDYENLLEGAVIIAPSRSGSTSEVVRAVGNAKRKAKAVICVTCKERNELSKLSDIVLELPWAFDSSVCQTRTVTNLYLALLMLADAFSKTRAITARMDTMIGHLENFMSSSSENLNQIASMDFDKAILLADSFANGIANEGAMAFIEIANTPALSYHLLDVRHGPMVIVNSKTLVLMMTGDRQPGLQRDLFDHLTSRQAKTVQFVSSGQPFAPAPFSFAYPADLSIAEGAIPFLYMAQMIAYRSAVRRNIDPEKPEGLSPWIEL